MGLRELGVVDPRRNPRCRRNTTRRQAKLVTMFEEFEHHSAFVNGQKIHYVRAGEGRSARAAARMAADLVHVAKGDPGAVTKNTR